MIALSPVVWSAKAVIGTHGVTLIRGPVTFPAPKPEDLVRQPVHRHERTFGPMTVPRAVGTRGTSLEGREGPRLLKHDRVAM